MIKRISPEKVKYYFSPYEETVLHIEPGETLTVETLDAASGLLKKDGDVLPPFDELAKIGLGINPVTGPIFIEGAEPGDCLVVEIKDIKCGVNGIATTAPGVGGLSGPYSILSPIPFITKICPIRNNKVFFPLKNGRQIELPLRPIVGTIGVAPKFEKIATVYHGQEQCGNVDAPDIGLGTKVILRVNVPGGLLSIGDIAAITGDGELCGAHIDTSSETTIGVDLVKRENAKYADWPQVENKNYIGSIGCPTSGSLDDAYRAAYHDLVKRMSKFYGFDLLDAYQLVSSVGQVCVNQGINPSWYCCTAKIQRSFL